jgi:hypothetical protein
MNQTTYVIDIGERTRSQNRATNLRTAADWLDAHPDAMILDTERVQVAHAYHATEELADSAEPADLTTLVVDRTGQPHIARLFGDVMIVSVVPADTHGLDRFDA